jgi:hypothetical protein
MKTISDHILDILQNSTRAEATAVTLQVEVSVARDILRIVITDNGKGIDPSIAERVTDPFTTTRKSRRVGLGLPLLRLHSELTSGFLKIGPVSSGKGTCTEAQFGLSHIDRQPLGDLAGTVTLFMTGNSSVDLVFSLLTDTDVFSLTTKELKEALEDDELGKPLYYSMIRDLLSDNIHSLTGGSL